MAVRPAAVAGSFYAADAAVLARRVRALLDRAEPADLAPKALILPHAGHAYSGPIAATGYRCLMERRGGASRVVLLGPAHCAPVAGLAASGATAFATPLGEVPVDRAGVERALALPGVALDDDAHAPEHSLEVHLPFLQVALPGASIVPLLAGAVAAEDVARVLEALWGGEETAIVVSSDLSHYEGAPAAEAHDRATAAAIERLDPARVGGEDACGAAGVRGLLLAARRRGLAARTLDLRHSGDTAGPRDAVVGYGAFVFFDPRPEPARA